VVIVYTFKKLLVTLFFLFLPVSVFAGADSIVSVLNDGNKGEWSLRKKTDEGYQLKYKNPKGVDFINDSIIDQELNEADISLSKLSSDIVSLVMNYPRDVYSFNFSSAEVPHILSACKQINLSAIDDSQAATIMVLCSKSSVLNNEGFTKLNAKQLLSPNNLYLDGKVKVAIEKEKAFLFDDDNVQMKNRPYLIKGNVVEVLEYQNSMLKIKYTGKKKDVLGWIKFSDIL